VKYWELIRQKLSKRRLKVWLQFIAFILIAFGVFAFWYGYSAFIQKPLANVDRSDLAALGNFLQGAVASVWSLAAFLFILVAFLGQQEELEHSRNQAAIQEKIAAQQRFENSFFSLLRLHRTIVDRVNAVRRRDNQPVGGSEAFGILCNDLGTAWLSAGNGHVNALDRIDKAYISFYQYSEPEIGHYFRTLYHIVRFVDQSSMSDQEKRDYEKFLRAQISSFELLLLFYNGLSSFGRRKFKPLIEKYALLEQVPKSRLLDPNHKELYEPEAFQDRT
jgi:hypothetical protein